MQKDPLGQATGAARFVGAVFGLVFFGIGITVIAFLWGFDENEFGNPPVFFKIFGSLIALAFVAMGGATAVSAIFGKRLIGRDATVVSAALHQVQEAQRSAAQRPQPIHYSCPHCGGTLGDKADVSPMGDTKCAFCGRWFNVHGRTA